MATTIAARNQLGPEDAGKLVTHEEFATLDFVELFTYERVKGRLVVLPPAGPDHREVSRPFRRELGLYWGLHPDIVHDVDVEGWVVTSPDDDRIPDICVYLVESSTDERVPQLIPDMIFEYVSGSRADQERDDIHKRAEYEEIGVREYIIVDRFKRTVLVLTLKDGQFTERLLSAADEYTSPLLPGMKVSLAEAFR